MLSTYRGITFAALSLSLFSAYAKVTTSSSLENLHAKSDQIISNQATIQANQGTILANQNIIRENQKTILSNQDKLNSIIDNQAVIIQHLQALHD
jgi:hypothetical protein